MFPSSDTDLDIGDEKLYDSSDDAKATPTKLKSEDTLMGVQSDQEGELCVL
jgi:hypothetical protein